MARHYLFGLQLDSSMPILAGRTSEASDGARKATLDQTTSSALARSWRPREALSMMERRAPGGRLIMAVEAHPELGYRVAAPRFGSHVISRDGSQIHSALPSVPEWRWQRLLFAQVLPLAATLQGIELFHANAVALGGRAIGFVAAAGTGKTSVGVHLVSRGATLLTDDVMALEASAAGVLVHPGPWLAGVHATELKAIEREGRGCPGEVLGRSGKLYLSIPTLDHPLPLAALYFLERRGDVDRLQILESRPPDPQLLLSSSFIWYLKSPDFLARHLDVCSRVAQSVSVSRVLIPASVGAGAVAAAIERHAAGE